MVKKKTGFFYYYFTRNIKQWALLTFVVPYNNIVPIIEIRNKETTRKKKKTRKKLRKELESSLIKSVKNVYNSAKHISKIIIVIVVIVWTRATTYRIQGYVLFAQDKNVIHLWIPQLIVRKTGFKTG
jgi:hypothetical protein